MDDNYKTLITLALQEDFDEIGDVTSESIFTDETAHAQLLSKSEGILAGKSIFCEVFHTIDDHLDIEFLKQDGDRLGRTECIAHVRGKALSILKGERTALNFISFMSGVATAAGTCAAEARHYGNTIVLDTRKTLPGYRALSKYAVKTGGAQNHRQGLYDMVMIKDNHVDAAGSIKNAVEKVRNKWGERFKIEVECRTLADVRQALELGVDIIMLDNMNKEQILEAIGLAKNRVLLEVSGGITLEEIKEIVPLGIDYISIGRITHSAPAFDFSLKIVLE
ncbi:MAG: carboxylating nicotinate-nucleotide diphosphorylase [Spirochaetales bacterium]|nr:carboxylating nicotinate-nucleotide diphosphorylase [Spirochaetales bacterium]